MFSLMATANFFYWKLIYLPQIFVKINPIELGVGSILFGIPAIILIAIFFRIFKIKFFDDLVFVLIFMALGLFTGATAIQPYLR